MAKDPLAGNVFSSHNNNKKIQRNRNTYNSAGFPGGSVIKNPPANAGERGSILGSGRSPGEKNGNPVQYSCLGNCMDRRA